MKHLKRAKSTLAKNKKRKERKQQQQQLQRHTHTHTYIHLFTQGEEELDFRIWFACNLVLASRFQAKKSIISGNALGEPCTSEEN